MATHILSARVQRIPLCLVLLLLPLVFAALPRGNTGKPEGPSHLYMVFGVDERQLFPLKEKPWFGIGRVEVELANGSWGNCTGTLIDRDLVLTAAHCLTVKGESRGENVWFRAGMQGRSSWGDARVVEKWIGTAWPDEKRAEDWAVLRIDQPLGDKTGWLPLTPEWIGEDKPITIVGYGDDFQGGRRVAIQSNCRLRFLHKRFGYFTHDCDMNSGTSGGPMVMFDGKLPHIVAMNVAHTTKHAIYHAASFSPTDANVAINLFKVAKLVEGLRAPALVKERDGQERPSLTVSSQP